MWTRSADKIARHEFCLRFFASCIWVSLRGPIGPFHKYTQIQTEESDLNKKKNLSYFLIIMGISALVISLCLLLLVLATRCEECQAIGRGMKGGGNTQESSLSNATHTGNLEENLRTLTVSGYGEVAREPGRQGGAVCCVLCAVCPMPYVTH